MKTRVPSGNERGTATREKRSSSSAPSSENRGTRLSSSTALSSAAAMARLSPTRRVRGELASGLAAGAPVGRAVGVSLAPGADRSATGPAGLAGALVDRSWLTAAADRGLHQAAGGEQDLGQPP